MKPLVSVIITTKNEEKHIENCLQSIKAQTYLQKNIEIIIVDNSSNDRTKNLGRKYTPLVFNYGPERSAQRNFGMLKKAKGKYLIYLDADMMLTPNVITEAVNKLEKEEIAAIYIPEIILGNSFWGRARRLERSFYDGTVIDCARVIRANVFSIIKGFDETLTGPEDWDLDKRIKMIGRTSLLCSYDFRRVENLITKSNEMNKLAKLISFPVILHNELSFNLKKYLHKKKYYSQSFSAYIKKWGENDNDLKKQLGFYYRYFTVFCESGKWKRLFFYPLRVLAIFGLRFSVGVVFLSEKFRFHKIQ